MSTRIFGVAPAVESARQRSLGCSATWDTTLGQGGMSQARSLLGVGGDVHRGRKPHRQ